jgi:hypothetical protein
MIVVYKSGTELLKQPAQQFLKDFGLELSFAFKVLYKLPSSFKIVFYF